MSDADASSERSRSMKVNVRLFAIAKDAMGDGEVEIELNDGATVADVRSVLLKRLPELNSMSSLLRFAVNEGYALSLIHI